MLDYERLASGRGGPPSTSWLAARPPLPSPQSPPVTVLALRETAVNPPPSAYVVAAPRPPLMMPTDLRTGHSASAVYYSSRGSAHGAVSQAAEDASEEEEEEEGGSRLVIRE